jgi:hypothetical protein
LASHRDPARRLDEIEKKYDSQFKVVFDAIRRVMRPPKRPPRKIGFRAPAYDAIQTSGGHVVKVAPPRPQLRLARAGRSRKLV